MKLSLLLFESVIKMPLNRLHYPYYVLKFENLHYMCTARRTGNDDTH